MFYKKLEFVPKTSIANLVIKLISLSAPQLSGQILKIRKEFISLSA